MLKFVDDFGYGKARPKGIFCLRIRRSGIVVMEIEDNNLVVDGAFFQMARLLAGDVNGRSITKIGFGIGAADPAPGDTTLTNQYLRVVSGYEYPENDRVKINWMLPVNEGNGMAIREFGLFTADNTLFARKTIEEAISKISAFSLEGSWTIIF
jgi:hypothetical protein